MSKFTEAVEQQLEGIDSVSTGVTHTCPECCYRYGLSEDEMKERIESGELYDEGSFSWNECESCGSSLGGDRYAAHGLDANGELIHLDICVDCVMYHANGDEPEEWEGE